MLTKDQFMEIWAGLVQSEKYFLWAVRPGMVTRTDPDGPTQMNYWRGPRREE